MQYVVDKMIKYSLFLVVFTIFMMCFFSFVACAEESSNKEDGTVGPNTDTKEALLYLYGDAEGISTKEFENAAWVYYEGYDETIKSIENTEAGASGSKKYLSLTGNASNQGDAVGGWARKADDTSSLIDIARCDRLIFSAKVPEAIATGNTKATSIQWGIEDDKKNSKKITVTTPTLITRWQKYAISLTDFSAEGINLSHIVAIQYALAEKTNQIDIDEVYIADCTDVAVIAPKKEIALLKGRELVFSDEFDADTIDSTIWRFDTDSSANQAGWGNNELQWYTDKNAYTQDGALVIEAKYETMGGKQYTSSRLHTHGNLTVHYGIIAARIKLPENDSGQTDASAWPAFWTLGVNFNGWGHDTFGGTVAWPHSGEIDIMESNYKDFGYTRTLSTVHWGNGNQKGLGTPAYYGGNTSLQDGTSQYHVYAVEWTEKEMKFYLDYELFHTHNILNPDTNQEEFTRPHFLLLNVAVGSATTPFIGGMPDSSRYPQKMYVDWVRVYK